MNYLSIHKSVVNFGMVLYVLIEYTTSHLLKDGEFDLATVICCLLENVCLSCM